MNDTKSIESMMSISKFVVKAIQKIGNRLPFDKTLKGHITEILGDNKYKVNIRKEDIVVKCVTGQELRIGDTVLVMYVQNNNNERYIIGKVN